jgi:predicted amidohydrolase YtcJ
MRVFRGGRVFDGDRYLGDASVAVDQDRVVAVGPDGEVREHAGAGAEEVDLAGGLLTPGFRDAHVHPLVGGLERLRCDLSGLSGREEYLDAVRRHAEEHPDTEWVRGGGWSIAAFPDEGPTAADLDAVVPDRPVFLPSSDHHDAWVNSRALELAGVGAGTPDPPDGWFVRDERGHPTGAVREAAMSPVWQRLTTSREEDRQALLEAQRYLHSLGITGWQDALIGGYAAIDDPTQAYLDLLAAGELTGRVRAAQWWDRHRGPEQVEDLVRRRGELADAGLDAGSVKLMMDGVAETLTATVTEPYLHSDGCPCGDRGLAFMSREQTREAMQAADAAGFQVHVHAIGDRAVHDALDGLELARRVNGLNDQRHHVAHLQLVRPEDRPRFGRLGVAANLEGIWAHAATPAVELMRPHLDEERMGWHYPFAELAASGAVLCGGSDWPVNTPDPMSAIHVLVNRLPAGSANGTQPLLPEQGLTLGQAFAAYTSGSAWVNHERAGAGRIQVGAVADLAVLDRDPFRDDPEQIAEARVVRTYVAGRAVSG